MDLRQFVRKTLYFKYTVCLFQSYLGSRPPLKDKFHCCQSQHEISLNLNYSIMLCKENILPRTGVFVKGYNICRNIAEILTCEF